jgi:hypothetical protein
MEGSLTLYHLIIALVVVLILVLILVVGVITVGLKKYKVIHDRQIWSHFIDEKITQAIVEGSEPVFHDIELNRLLEQKPFRLLFLESLVMTTRRFSGTAVQEVYKLFHHFNLKAESLEKLAQHNKKYIVAGGIQELTAMKSDDVLSQIQDSLKSPNQVVYQEAQYSMVALQGFNGLFFLNDLTHILSDWQQMRLLDSLKSIPTDSSASILSWLQNDNDSIRIFCLRLIRKFQLLEYYTIVESLLQHPIPKVRIQAIKTLQALENNDTISQLICVFGQEVIRVQKEIIKVFKIAKSKESIAFLKEQLSTHPSTKINLLAAETLLELGEKTYLHELKYTASEPISLIVKHALQEKV